MVAGVFISLGNLVGAGLSRVVKSGCRDLSGEFRGGCRLVRAGLLALTNNLVKTYLIFSASNSNFVGS